MSQEQPDLTLRLPIWIDGPTMDELRRAGITNMRMPQRSRSFESSAVAITATVAQTVLPSVVTILQSWLQRNREKSAKVVVEQDGKRVELEIHGDMSEQETQRLLTMVSELRV